MLEIAEADVAKLLQLFDSVDVAYRGEVPSVGRVVDGESAAGDSGGRARRQETAPEASTPVVNRVAAREGQRVGQQVRHGDRVSLKGAGPNLHWAQRRRRASQPLVRSRAHADHHRGGLPGPLDCESLTAPSRPRAAECRRAAWSGSPRRSSSPPTRSP